MMNIDKVYLRNLVLSIVIALLVVMVGSALMTKDYATRISLQFKGIEKGLNPDETLFDYETIISEDVLKSVAKASEITYDESIKKNIVIRSILPPNIVDRIKEKRIAGENYTYYPNEFEIVLKNNNTLSLTAEEQLNFIDNYSQVYKDYFIDTHQYPFMDLNAITNFFDYKSYDYPELTNVFNNQFNMIFSYLNVLIQDDPEFVSSKGYTFTDLKETIRVSKDLEIKKIDSLVNAYQLTNDMEELVIKYNYMIKKYQLNQGEKAQVSQISDTLLSVLEANKKEVIVPTGSETISITTYDDTYDQVASQATESKMSASDISEEIQYLEDRLLELQERVPSTPEILKAEAEVNALVEQLVGKIDRWILLIEEMAGEYYNKKYSQSVSTIVSSEEIGGLSTKMSLGIFILTIILVNSVLDLYAFLINKRKNA